MKQCIDSNGVPITGLFRDQNGALIVVDRAAHHKYIKDRELLLSKDKRIADLEDKVNKLITVVEQLQTKV